MDGYLLHLRHKEDIKKILGRLRTGSTKFSEDDKMNSSKC